jgi:hypothetical protein
MIGTPILIFTVIVLLLAATIGWLTDWDQRSDKDPANGTYRYDPERTQKSILENITLTDQEREWMQEVAALELPRRHLFC